MKGINSIQDFLNLKIDYKEEKEGDKTKINIINKCEAKLMSGKFKFNSPRKYSYVWNYN